MGRKSDYKRGKIGGGSKKQRDLADKCIRLHVELETPAVVIVGVCATRPASFEIELDSSKSKCNRLESTSLEEGRHSASDRPRTEERRRRKSSQEQADAIQSSTRRTRRRRRTRREARTTRTTLFLA